VVGPLVDSRIELIAQQGDDDGHPDQSHCPPATRLANEYEIETHHLQHHEYPTHSQREGAPNRVTDSEYERLIDHYEHLK
jgi:hypothetical protein